LTPDAFSAEGSWCTISSGAWGISSGDGLTSASTCWFSVVDSVTAGFAKGWSAAVLHVTSVSQAFSGEYVRIVHCGSDSQSSLLSLGSELATF
jgi:hypothetical protein